MRAYLIWFVVALAGSLAAAAETKTVGPDPDYQRFMTLPPTTDPPPVVPMDPEFANRLLKQIQYELDLTRKASSDLTTQVDRYEFRLETVNRHIASLDKELAPSRAFLLRQKQRLSQARVKLDHSWLVLQRCPNFERLDNWVRRYAKWLADEEAIAGAKLNLSRYLRLLNALDNPKPVTRGE